jgi:acyl-CoA thioesterase-1
MTGIKRTFCKKTLVAEGKSYPGQSVIDGLAGIGAGRISLPAQRDLKKQGKLGPNAVCAARCIRLDSMRARETRRRPKIAAAFFKRNSHCYEREQEMKDIWLRLYAALGMRSNGATLVLLVGFILCSAAALHAERKREGIEWIYAVCHHPGATNLPRVLLIGDSIANMSQEYVSEELAGTAYVSTYTTSKCITDRSYLKELRLMLSENDYALVQFNNGLHCFGCDFKQWEQALSGVIKLLRDEGKGAALIWASTTPTVSPDNTRLVKEFNAIAARVMKENNIPVNDLFSLMDPLDRKQYWTDNCHHSPEGRKIAAKQVAAVIRENLGAQKISGPAGSAVDKSAEKMDWTKVFWYDADKSNLPRVLVIGDSIYDDYQRDVNKALSGTAFLSTFSTSRSFADPLYVKELKYILDEYTYGVILFNNGLHCNKTDPIWKTILPDIPQWETGLCVVIKLIRDEGKGAKMIWAGSVPWNEGDSPAEVKELNAAVARVMKKNNIPSGDPYPEIQTGPQYNEQLTARIVATICRQLGVDTPSGASTNADLKAAGSMLGPTGTIGSAAESNPGQ